MPNDPESVRFRSIAEIMLRGIHRCVAAERELQEHPQRISIADAPVLNNLADSLPEALDFVSVEVLSVSDLSPNRRVLAAQITVFFPISLQLSRTQPLSRDSNSGRDSRRNSPSLGAN